MSRRNLTKSNTRAAAAADLGVGDSVTNACGRAGPAGRMPAGIRPPGGAAADRKLRRPTKAGKTHEEDTRAGVLFWSSEPFGMERKHRNTKAAPGTCGRSGNRVTMGTSYEKAEE